MTESKQTLAAHPFDSAVEVALDTQHTGFLAFLWFWNLKTQPQTLPSRVAFWRAMTQGPHNPPFPLLVSAIWSSYPTFTGPQSSPRSRFGQVVKVVLTLAYGSSQAAQHLRRVIRSHIAIK